MSSISTSVTETMMLRQIPSSESQSQEEEEVEKEVVTATRSQVSSSHLRHPQPNQEAGGKQVVFLPALVAMTLAAAVVIRIANGFFLHK